MKVKILFSSVLLSLFASAVLCSCSTQSFSVQESAPTSIPNSFSEESERKVIGAGGEASMKAESEEEQSETSVISAEPVGETSERDSSLKCPVGEESESDYSVVCMVKGEERELTEQQITDICDVAVEATSDKTDVMLNTIIVPDDIEKAKENGIYIEVFFHTDCDCFDNILLLITNDIGCASRAGGSKIVVSGENVSKIYQILDL